MSTREQLKERRLERMRAGQHVAEIVPLPSDEEIRVALVPLTEAEYIQVLQLVSRLEAMDTMAGMTFQTRVQSEEVLVRSIRDPQNLETRLFDSVADMTENFEVSDIDYLVEEYNSMTEKSNPAIEQISQDEFEQLKKVLVKMDWNDLSGRSWYAAKRFLGALITEGLLTDNLPGSSLINRSTTTTDSEKSTPTA
jgi:hypothetical protein